MLTETADVTEAAEEIEKELTETADVDEAAEKIKEESAEAEEINDFSEKIKDGLTETAKAVGIYEVTEEFKAEPAAEDADFENKAIEIEAANTADDVEKAEESEKAEKAEMLEYPEYADKLFKAESAESAEMSRVSSYSEVEQASESFEASISETQREIEKGKADEDERKAAMPQEPKKEKSSGMKVVYEKKSSGFIAAVGIPAGILLGFSGIAWLLIAVGLIAAALAVIACCGLMIGITCKSIFAVIGTDLFSGLGKIGTVVFAAGLILLMICLIVLIIRKVIPFIVKIYKNTFRKLFMTESYVTSDDIG